MRFQKENTMGKTYGKRRPKKPHALVVLLGALTALILWVMCWPTVWSAELYDEPSGSALHILGGYQAETEITGSSPAEFTRHYFAGLGYSHFIADDASMELAAWEPVYDAGLDNFSASAGLKYWFGYWYVPLDAIYRGDLDTLGFGSGIGTEFLAGDRTCFRIGAGGQYLGDSSISEQWTWSITTSIGWRLGNDRD